MSNIYFDASANSVAARTRAKATHINTFREEVEDAFDNITDAPTLTGAPTAPTATTDTNSTQLATTEFVHDLSLELTSEASLPGQAGNAGKFLKTDGTTALWDNVDLSSKQNALISGINTKTINSESLLNSGNVDLQTVLVSGTSIKTINSTAVLGSGDIEVQETLTSGTNIKTVNGESLLSSGNVDIGKITVKSFYLALL